MDLPNFSQTSHTSLCGLCTDGGKQFPEDMSCVESSTSPGISP